MAGAMSPPDGEMKYGGSVQSRARLRFDHLVEGLERQAPSLDKWSFWIGAAVGGAAIGVTFLHHLLPNDSLTEDCVVDIAASIRTVHRWIGVPLADLLTYACGPLMVLGIVLWLAKRFNRAGSTRSS
jgi:hypothetical protein